MHQELQRKLIELHDSTPDRPYSIVHRVKLAKAYKGLGYPDLATGDAYKALILIDEIKEEGEYYGEAIETARADLQACPEAELYASNDSGQGEALDQALEAWSQAAYDILIPCLLDCGSFRSAFDFIKRALKAFPNADIYRTHQRTLQNKVRSHFENNSQDPDTIDVQDYPDKGLVRRELYPWNEYEPDRFSAEVLQTLNGGLMSIAPKLEVRAVELPLLNELSPASTKKQSVKQLGLFAKEDIQPGEQVLKEKSLLTAISRLHDAFCDACSMPLSTDDASVATVACEDCNEVFFCSADCHDLAQESYHSSLCGVNIDRQVSAAEAADSLYTLLVVRAMALAETQQLHPLELNEVRYIWGDYHGQNVKDHWRANADVFGSLPRTLPFSFDANVLRPLHILEKMDVNIFEQSHRYDTWVINTLYAKLRGTASARQGVDGRPEIGAVHPMWCLANHSCDPNVAWEWRGSMRFWTRDKLVDWAGRDPSKRPGLKKDEEVLSHYCDVSLAVKERREWAVGALGGICVCPRCVWEDSNM